LVKQQSTAKFVIIQMTLNKVPLRSMHYMIYIFEKHALHDLYCNYFSKHYTKHARC